MTENKNPKISVIVPVYNVEKYIRRCLDSILNQTFTSFEVLLVDDGSIDDSGKICDEYAAKDKRVRAFHKDNGGVSSARNEGINHAQCDFITFVDSDDWIGQDTLSKVYEFLLNDTALDILILNSIKSDSNQKCYDWTKIIKNGECFSGITLFQEKKYFRGSVCGVIYRKEFLNENNIYFPVGVRNGEDTIFFGITQTFAVRIRFENLDFYYVYNRLNSASKSIDTQNLKLYIEGLRYCVALKENEHFKNKDLSLIEFTRYRLISNLIAGAVGLNISYNKLIKEYKILTQLPVYIKHTPVSRIKIGILNCSFFTYFMLAKLKHKLVSIIK